MIGTLRVKGNGIISKENKADKEIFVSFHSGLLSKEGIFCRCQILSFKGSPIKEILGRYLPIYKNCLPVEKSNKLYHVYPFAIKCLV